MFHFPAFPPHALCIQAWVTGHDSCRVSPFGNPRITARLAAPRGLSQPPTSFIGSWCQGIHRAPLLTWPQSNLMLASTVQFSRYGRDPTRARRVPGCRPFDEDQSHSAATAPLALSSGGRRREVQRFRLRARSLRTQQRAEADHPRSRPVPAARGSCTGRRGRGGLPTGQCSTLEHHPRSVRPGHGSGRDTRRSRARCSLERR